MPGIFSWQKTCYIWSWELLLENQNRKYVERLLSTLRTMDNKILFDILKNKKYNYNKRVASKRKSSLPAARFLFVKT